ncbi:MAG: elongation factor G [Lachnospiraceae bacterium]|jgi:elongation factor G|nr:elongation factor G [Lachnospiraceae bacterium]
MNVFTTDKIRNVVLLGHGGSGKTTLTEAMALLSGVTTRMGKVTEGNTISDYSKEEQKRHFTISAAVVPIVWQNVKINVIDSPGYFDFVGEAEEAVSAASAAIIVIDAKSGVEVGTIRAWELCEKYKLPRMIFVTAMDVDNASYANVCKQLAELYSTKVAPVHLPIYENEKCSGSVNVLFEKAYKWKDKDLVACDVPEAVADDMASYRDAIMETLASTSEEMMDRYFAGEAFSEAEINEAMQSNIIDGTIVPLLFGSSVLCQGVKTLLDDIVAYMPSPLTHEVSGKNTKSGAEFVANHDSSKVKSAYIWKTIVDPFIGKYSLIKVNSGIFRTDDMIYNEARDIEEKCGKIYVLQGNKPIEVKELHAGDIGALAKLTDAATGNSLSTKADPIKYEPWEISTPYTYKRYIPKNKGDIDKISQALQKMSAEDMTIRIKNDAENRQTLIYGMGDMHLDIVQSRLKNEYKVDIDLITPRVAYRETLKKKADVEGKHKKQSGGHGQYGHVKMIFEPSGDLETAYVYEQTVVGGTVPRNYYPAVDKGLAESVLKGPLAGYPVVGVKGTLYDGSYHAVDSSEMAFKLATILAFKKGFMEAGPVLLEPIVLIKVTVPDAYAGDVMGDLNKRRGRVLGMNHTSGGKQVIEADMPMTGVQGYCTDLRSMTGGRGDYSYEFVRYEQAPSDIQEKEVAARVQAMADGEEE